MKELPYELATDWQDDALCRSGASQLTADDFFYEGRFKRNSRQFKEHIARLRTTCAACPVKAECNAFAEETLSEGGFWAGITAEERQLRRRVPVIKERIFA